MYPVSFTCITSAVNLPIEEVVELIFSPVFHPISYTSLSPIYATAVHDQVCLYLLVVPDLVYLPLPLGLRGSLQKMCASCIR